MTGIIVVGVDGSETALRAAHTARDLAVSVGATLHVVSAFDSDKTQVFGSGSDQWIVSDAGNAETVARSVAEGLRRPDITVTYAAARGKPAEALIREAERTQCLDDRGRQPAHERNRPGLGERCEQRGPQRPL